MSAEATSYYCPDCNTTHFPDAGPVVCAGVCTHPNQRITDQTVPAFSDETRIDYRCPDCGAAWHEWVTLAELRAEQEGREP